MIPNKKDLDVGSRFFFQEIFIKSFLYMHKNLRGGYTVILY